MNLDNLDKEKISTLKELGLDAPVRKEIEAQISHLQGLLKHFGDKAKSKSKPKPKAKRTNNETSHADAIRGLLTKKKGMTTSEIFQALTESGHEISKNVLGPTLNKLQKDGGIKFEKIDARRNSYMLA